MIISEEVKKDLIIAAKLIKTHCIAGSCYECVFKKNTDSSKCPLDKPPYYWDLDDLKICVDRH